MSTNRRRNSGMRRAYLKKTSHRYDDSPDSALKAAIGLGRDINPIVVLPHRAIQWLDKNKHTPTMTEPMRDRVESWRVAVKEQRNEYFVTLVDTPIRCIRMFFNGFDARAIYWFKWLDRISGIERESFTFSSRVKAMDHFTKWSIPWK